MLYNVGKSEKLGERKSERRKGKEREKKKTLVASVKSKNMFLYMPIHYLCYNEKF
jgi:hypothetical protein